MMTKKEMAKRLLKGDGVEKDEVKAVSLLEDCVAHGDADAMVMLAKCCALGCGMKHDAERAEALLSDAAKKGNKEAQRLKKVINDCKGKQSIDLENLKGTFQYGLMFDKRPKLACSVDHVALVMNIVPCQILNLRGQAQECQSHVFRDGSICVIK